MEKKYLKELTNIITTTLDAHKMAEWDNKSARDVIAGVMVKKFASYMEDQLSIFKPIKDGEK
tara:strand:- start:372 stop:557 length:186 start_codon:yes stop_codon:yes gene_type:complete